LAGIAGKRTASGATRVPSATRGTALAGGSRPSRTQPVRPSSSARMVQVCGFGLGCCTQALPPNGALVGSGSGAAPCWVLAMM
jgi:hypothetical protein